MLANHFEKYRRLINFAWHVFLANYKNLGFPFKLNYAVTYRCNQKCLTCNIWESPPEEEMTIENIEQFFQNNSKFSWIDLTGGEIFLRKDIREILSAIVLNCRNLYLLHFPTNGTCHNEVIRAVDYLIESPVPLIIVTVSIDGNEETQKHIRGRDNAFKLAVKTFLELKKRTSAKLNVFAGLTVSQFNVHLVPDIFNTMEEEIPGFKFDDIHVNFAQTSDHFYKNNGDLLVEPAKQIDTFRKIAEKSHKNGKGIVKYLESRYQGLLLEFLKKNKNPAICQALSCSIFMDPKGFIYPCITWDKNMGKINGPQYSLESFFKRPDVMEVRKDVIKGNCPNCWTPCEAYQTIMASTSPFSRWKTS